MSFLSPVAFALGALIPVIVALYLLKLRRTEQVVSSVYLWQRMVRDLEANAPWQRLKHNLLLLLQLGLLILLIVALARPFTWAEGVGGEAMILILDTSLSMSATDVAPDRMSTAKAHARQLVDGLPDGASVTVIAAGEGAQVLLASSHDVRQIHQAIDAAEATALGSDLSAALELASAIAARRPETEVVILSDGRVQLPERLTLRGRVRYLPIGNSGDNQAIALLSLQAVAGGRSLAAFVQVSNYGPATVQRRLVLEADGRPVSAHDLEIPARGERSIVEYELPAETRVLEARLEGSDALPLDDRAWAVHRSTQPAVVNLVTEGNLFLETALSLLPGLEVVTVRPADLERLAGPTADEAEGTSLEPAETAGLTILDAYVPVTATLPSGNLLFIAPPRSTDYFSVTGKVEQPVPRTVDADDPLLTHVHLQNASVLDVVRVPLPRWSRPLVVGDYLGGSVPLLFAGETDGRRIAVLTFDLRRSDLPLQVAFPLLLANLTAWLAPGAGQDIPAQVTPGAAVTFSFPAEAEALEVTRPGGSVTRLLPTGGRAVFADTEVPGVYAARWQLPSSAEASGPREIAFAVNVYSPQESDVGPVDTLPLSGGPEREQGELGQGVQREWWRLLALGALVLLVAEWLVYQRASVFRIVSAVRRWLALRV